MKNAKLFLLAIAAIFAASCGNVIPEPPQPLENVVVDFTCTKYDGASGLTYKFVSNSSAGVTPYKWEFGDNTYSFADSYGYTTHKYAQSGIYQVTLTCRDANKYEYTGTKNVEIGYGGDNPETPRKATITAIEYRHVDNDGKYYKAKLMDDKGNVIFDTYYMEELYNNSNLPYEYTYQFPHELTNWSNHAYYELYVYHNNTFNGSGTQCLHQKLTKEQIQQYPQYHDISNNSGNTIVRLKMKYE